MEIGKFIGVVTEIIDVHNFTFHANNNYKCQLQQVVGLNIEDNKFVLSSITRIDVGYFLKDKEEYFTSLSVDNKLEELSLGTRKPKMATKIKATYLGIYEYDVNKNKFFESALSIDVHTPSIFQEVYNFDFVSIEEIYGLDSKNENKIKLGKFIYPSYLENNDCPDVFFNTESFNSHTLISGVTGSGKSRLTALLINQLTANGGHITIIDPHDEYIKLADTRTAKVSFFSKNMQAYKERADIYKRDLSFTSSILSPQIFAKLLPELSPQQIDYIYEVFEEIITKKNITIKTITETIIGNFNSEFEAEGLNILVEVKEKIKENNRIVEKVVRKEYKLTLATEYAQKDFKNNVTFFNRYVSCFSNEMKISKLGKLHVIYAVLKKILTLYENGFFPENLSSPIPSWLDVESRSSINIMNLDYDSNAKIRRYINAIIQCFFTPQIKNRILIVDEAHLLLNDKSDKSDTATLLSRLLRESRKFKLSIIFITQNEIDVPDEIKSQFQNRFRFREEKEQELKYLDNQTCLCSIYRGKLSFPMRVDNVEEIN